jgi:hypothetical protein
MGYNVLCTNDGVNYDYSVTVNGAVAAVYPYTSWYNPSGSSATTAKSLAFELAQNLQMVLNQPAHSWAVTCVQDGVNSAFDVEVNGSLVTSYPYSGIWAVGSVIASQTKAKAAAFEVAQNLSAILAPAH